jgi:hypothetical protein
MRDSLPKSSPAISLHSVDPVPTRPGRNGGRLWSGNPKAKGRPPSQVSAAARAAFDKRIPMLERFADNDKLPEWVRMKAVELLAKAGKVLTSQPGEPTDVAIMVNVRGREDDANVADEAIEVPQLPSGPTT